MKLSVTEIEILTFLYEWNRPIRAGDLSKEINTPHSTVNSILGRLTKKGVVNWEKYRLVSLTGKGRSYLNHITRHRHLFAFFLTRTLEIPIDLAHQYVNNIPSGNISCELIKMINKKLNNPNECECGKIIPELKTMP